MKKYIKLTIVLMSFTVILVIALIDFSKKEKISISETSFFFDTQISDVDTLNALLKLGATDVYIVENLCFELDKISELVHSYNVAIRVYPNIAQSK